MNFENAFIGPQSIQLCHFRSKTPLTNVDRLRGPPRPIQRGRWPPRVPRRLPRAQSCCIARRSALPPLSLSFSLSIIRRLPIFLFSCPPHPIHISLFSLILSLSHLASLSSLAGACGGSAPATYAGHRRRSSRGRLQQIERPPSAGARGHPARGGARGLRLPVRRRGHLVRRARGAAAPSWWERRPAGLCKSCASEL